MLQRVLMHLLLFLLMFTLIIPPLSADMVLPGELSLDDVLITTPEALPKKTSALDFGHADSPVLQKEFTNIR